MVKPETVPGQAVLRFNLTGYTAIPNPELAVTMAGVVIAEGIPGFESLEPIGSSRNPLTPTGSYVKALPALEAGDSLHFSAQVMIIAEGSGSIAVTALQRLTAESAVTVGLEFLHVLAVNGEVLIGNRTLRDLKDEARQRGFVLSPSDSSVGSFFKSIGDSSHEQLGDTDKGFESPVTSVLRSSPTRARFFGIVVFLDENNRKHPVRLGEVDVELREGQSITTLGTTTSDSGGAFEVIADLPAQLPQQASIVCVARSVGRHVRVERPVRRQGRLFHETFTWESAPITVRSAGTNVGPLEIIAKDDGTLPPFSGFEIYEAVNHGQIYMNSLGEALGQATVRVDRKSRFVIRYGGSHRTRVKRYIELAPSDCRDWDVIHHEYGHFVQALKGTADSPGGPHFLGEDLCGRQVWPGYDPRGRSHKGMATALAWGEGWASFFAVMLQAELQLDTLGISDVGDEWFANWHPMDRRYDLEISLEERGAVDATGEGDEVAIARVLWDLYDTRDDDLDQGVSLTATELWQATKMAIPKSFSGFWQELTRGFTLKKKLLFGGIASSWGIGPTLTQPGDDFSLVAGTPLTLEWERHSCATSGYGATYYKVHLYDRNLSTALWTSSQLFGSPHIIPSKDLSRILENTQGDLIWLVVGSDDTHPATGPYYSYGRRLRQP